MEAACFLKKRGVLLAILSRNEEARIISLFDRIAGGRLRLADFAARRINWRLKTDNMAEILEEVRLTPASVVFVDDNPVERAAMQARFPAIRCLGSHPYYLRRILLWSAETQVPFISDESERRTELVQAQITRDQHASGMSREAFLGTLRLRMKIIDIRSTGDAHFPRALELINKTNQFNTTGGRRTEQECVKLFEAGSIFHAFVLEDVFSNYGLVGVAIVAHGHISQFVMSCRVLGLGAEDALLAHIAAREAAAGRHMLSADYVATNLNAPARDLYARHDFTEQDGVWRAPVIALRATPAHIELI
jgi:FkbH-like protein